MSTSNMKIAFSTCKNYDKIVNFNYNLDDEISEKVIESYKMCILNPNVKVKKEELKGLDEAVNEYVENRRFFKYIQDSLKNLISKNLIDEVLKLYRIFKHNEFKAYANTDWI